MKFSTSKKKLREFGIFVGVIFPFLFGYLLPFIFQHEYRYWTIYIGLPIFTLGLIAPSKLRFFYFFWMRLGNALGWANSRLILGIVYLIVLLPLAFIMKLFGYDPLKKKKNNVVSYKELKKNSKIDFTRIF